MTETVRLVTELTSKKHYDILVAGGGVAGVAAAITARRRGRSVLLLEKSNILGGLATLGLVNYFVPMCNGRGHQVIFGLCDRWVRESARYGYNKMDPRWSDRKNGIPAEPMDARLTETYSPYIFALQMTEMVREEGIDLLFDCVAAEPVMEGNLCRGVVTESKSGREYYTADMVIDATGDCDLLRRGGVPTVTGKNYFTYLGKQITLESCAEAVKRQDIGAAFRGVSGGAIDLYGRGQPEDVPLWSGTTVEEVTDYLVTNQLAMLKKLKPEDRKSREVVMLPMMPNFRTTCRIDGDYTLRQEDVYRHFADSVCAINDFDHRDALFEVPLRCLTRKEYPNLITAGRSASGEGYGWDVLRVIPPAILTGQAAAEACALALETDKPVAEVEIAVLQQRLEQDDDIMVHFPDEWVPENGAAEYDPAPGHI